MAASAYCEVRRPTTVSASYHGAFERLERFAGKLARTRSDGSFILHLPTTRYGIKVSLGQIVWPNPLIYHQFIILTNGPMDVVVLVFATER
jgi:hypothetical protein